MDLLQEERQNAIDYFIANDIEYDINWDTDKLIIRYYECLQRRLTDFKTDRILHSKEYENDITNLGQEHLDAISDIEKRLIHGDSIERYQSKLVVIPEKLDRLLINWGIYHLHLNSENPAHNRFNKRSNKLLFMYIDGCTTYFITVIDHIKPGQKWHLREFLKIIDTNWPSILDLHVIKGIISLEYSATDDEIEELANNGINYTIEVNGKFLNPPGGGFTLGNTSLYATLRLLDLKKRNYRLNCGK